MTGSAAAALPANEQSYAISLQDVADAAARVAPYVHRTPVLTCASLDALAGGVELHFKCEVFQKSGSFKARGATNAVYSLTDEEAAKGVVTHSSGNHAGAVAWAAQRRGIAAHIVVPRNTPQCKVEAVRSYGGQLYFCDPTMDAREAECARIQALTGASFVHPYNHPRVMAGQGTLALELMEQVPDLDVIVVPVSGGGMISGVATVAKALRPSITVLAAEPVGTNDAADVARCKAQGQLVACEKPKTIADGLQGRLGDKTWPIVRDKVDGVLTVTEAEIVAAMALVYERLKVVVEPSGAVGLAAVLGEQFRQRRLAAAGGGPEAGGGGGAAGPEAGGAGGGGAGAGQRRLRVGVVLCGGNVDLGAKGVWEPQSWQPAA